MGSKLQLAVVLAVIPFAVRSADSTVLGPSGQVLIAPAAYDLQQVAAPQLAPGTVPQQIQADCLTEEDVFYGSDFLSTERGNTSSASECCAACKLAADCTVWNWCGSPGGCILPSDLESASNKTSYPYQSCIWKPRPISYAGTLPMPPTTNTSSAMAGWTSGVPINATLLPALEGYELTAGIEMEYSEETDFFCTGSSTSKPVCQFYGNAKGGAQACFENEICRGFQICWSFPTPSAKTYMESGIIRLKAGAEAPLNISGAALNPYCGVYVLTTGAASAPNSGADGYSLPTSGESKAQQAAEADLNTGRRLRQAPAADNASAIAMSGTIRGNQQGALPAIVSLAPAAAPGGSTPAPQQRRASAQAPQQRRASAPAPQQVSSFSASASGAEIAASLAPAAKVPALGSGGVYGTNFTTPFLEGAALQAFKNATFNFTQCYSNAPTISVTLQSQLFPLQGPTLVHSIHTWTELPFDNNGLVCCAFRDINDVFLDLETGILAESLPMFVATDPSLVTGAALKDYDTTPVSVVQPLVYIPPGQINSPYGEGRQFTFPKNNGSAYIANLEIMHFSVAQTALGNEYCTQGSPQLAAAVDFLSVLLTQLSEGQSETPGGIPTNLEFITATQISPDGALNNVSCLAEAGAEYEGDLLPGTPTLNATAEICCEACWIYFDPASGTQCDVWVLDSKTGVCQLKNSTAASEFQAVPANRGSSYSSYTSGRKTAVLPSNATDVFTYTEPDV